MSKKQEILKEIEQVPETSLDGALEFVRLLRMRGFREKLDSSIVSQSSLRKDCLREEEDEAWRDL